jgi:hypothetical protein
MNSQMNLVFIIGWVFLIISWIWPKHKWGGITIKMLLNGISLGLFIANAIYHFL